MSIAAPATNPASDLTLTLPTTIGSNGQHMKVDGSGNLGWETPAGGLFSSYALVIDQKSANTDGGTFTQDAWQTRDLNTEGYDPDGIVSVSSNKFTLGAGSYLIKWSCPAYKANKNASRLYDVTNSAAITPVGSAEHLGTTVAIQTRSTGAARVTPSGSTEYRIEHHCTTTRADNGFGFSTNLQAEVYTIGEIYKEA